MPNDFEEKFAKQMAARKFTVLHKGWPDFLVLNEAWTMGFAVELKRDGQKVSADQELMHKALARFGVRVFVARDTFDDLLTRRGKVLLLPCDVKSMVTQLKEKERELQQIFEEVATMREEITTMRTELKALPVILEEQHLPSDKPPLTLLDLNGTIPVDPILQSNEGQKALRNFISKAEVRDKDDQCQ